MCRPCFDGGMARKPSRHVGTLGDMAYHGYSLTLNCGRCLHRADVDLEALILTNGEHYLLRKVVDRAICSKCGDRNAEVTCTLGVVGAAAFSYPEPVGP
jgi:hypothetical protein